MGEEIQEVLRYSEDDYISIGFALTRENGKFSIVEVVEIDGDLTDADDYVDYDITKEHNLTLTEVLKLAKNKSDLRVPDVKTTDKYLLGLYKMILEFKKELKDNKWIGPKVNTLMFYEGSFKVRIIANKEYDTKKLNIWFEKHIYTIPNLSGAEIKIENDIIYVHYWLTIDNKIPLEEIPGKFYNPAKKYPYVKLELI